MTPLAELLKPSTFEEDEPVCIAAVPQSALPGPIEKCQWQYISERLWHRLLALGNAYDLHFSKIIEPVIDSVLLPEQCDSFSEELVFLGGFIDDQALHQALEVLSAKLLQVHRTPGFRLVISPP